LRPWIPYPVERQKERERKRERERDPGFQTQWRDREREREIERERERDPGWHEGWAEQPAVSILPFYVHTSRFMWLFLSVFVNSLLLS
jgi:hypothetical protein